MRYLNSIIAIAEADRIIVYPNVKNPTSVQIKGCGVPKESRYIIANHQVLNDISKFLMKEGKTEEWGRCEVKTVMEQHISFDEAFCRCRANDICSYQKQYILNFYCLSDYSITNLNCENLKRDLLNAEIPPQSSDVLDLYIERMLQNNDDILPETLVPSYAEGFQLYLIHIALEKFQKFTVGHKQCGMTSFDGLTGWQFQQILYSNEFGEEGVQAVVALFKRSRDNYMILVNDLDTTFKGRIVSQYELGFKYFNGKLVPVQDGIASFISAVASTLELTFLLTLPENSITRILFVGEGVHGGAMSAALAEFSAAHWRIGMKLQVDHVSFNAPLVGSTDFYSSYSKRVNGRNITSKYSGGKGIPCRTQKVCSTAESLFDRNKIENKENQSFNPLRLQIIIDTDKDEIFHNEFWTDKKRRLDIYAHNFCAVRCWLIKKYNINDKNNMCDNKTCQTEN